MLLESFCCVLVVSVALLSVPLQRADAAARTSPVSASGYLCQPQQRGLQPQSLSTAAGFARIDYREKQA